MKKMIRISNYMLASVSTGVSNILGKIIGVAKYLLSKDTLYTGECSTYSKVICVGGIVISDIVITGCVYQKKDDTRIDLMMLPVLAFTVFAAPYLSFIPCAVVTGRFIRRSGIRKGDKDNIRNLFHLMYLLWGIYGIYEYNLLYKLDRLLG